MWSLFFVAYFLFGLMSEVMIDIDIFLKIWNFHINFFHSSHKASMDISSGSSSNEWQLFNRIRGQDIKLLKKFSVGYICDLMVEKKKVKFGMK